MTYRTEHARNLRKLRACEEACAYADTHATLQDAWDACERGDWMAWMLDRADVDKRAKVGCLAEVTALVLPIYEKRYPNDSRVRDCVETCLKYARGEASEDDLRMAKKTAADAYAAAAADAAAAYADAYAAAAAADAAAAAYAAAYADAAAAADAAAYADAYAAAAAYAAAYADAAADAMRKKISDVIRAHFPFVPTIKVTP